MLPSRALHTSLARCAGRPLLVTLPGPRHRSHVLATHARGTCTWKISPFCVSRSARSMPGPRGLAPIISAQSASAKISYGSMPMLTCTGWEARLQVKSQHPTGAEARLGVGRMLRNACRVLWDGKQPIVQPVQVCLSLGPRAAAGTGCPPAPWPRPPAPPWSARCRAAAARWAGPCRTPHPTQAVGRDTERTRLLGTQDSGIAGAGRVRRPLTRRLSASPFFCERRSCPADMPVSSSHAKHEP